MKNSFAFFLNRSAVVLKITALNNIGSGYALSSVKWYGEYEFKYFDRTETLFNLN